MYSYSCLVLLWLSSYILIMLTKFYLSKFESQSIFQHEARVTGAVSRNAKYVLNLNARIYELVLLNNIKASYMIAKFYQN